jgi:hypothetical protein
MHVGQLGVKAKPATLEEWRVIRTERLKCQRAAATLAGYDNVYEYFQLPGADHLVNLRGRSRDGSLLAEILVWGPGLKRAYRRRIRLVPESRLGIG